MELRTELNINPSSKTISLTDKIVTIGSCFADEIGAKLANNKFKTLINPFGTVYNPLSIFQQLDYCMANSGAPAKGFLQRDGLFFHHDFHSSWFDESQEMLRSKLKSQIELVRESLKNCQVLMITFGTAWGYEHLGNNLIVANCHKLPSSTFNKFLLTKKNILTSFEVFHRRLKEFNPTAQIILTVSPVRHLKDTLELNSVSKSILRLTCHTLTETFDNVQYFPAYEIMMDDLRDYRFYKPDMVHPSSQAVDYIWDKFAEVYFNADTKALLQKWSKVKTAMQHKPFHQEGDSHQKFLQSLLGQLNDLNAMIDVTAEIETVKSALK